MTAVDLVDFVRQRLDEDEQTARAATPGPWAWTPETDVWDQNGPTLIREGTDAADAELVEVAAGWGHDAWGIHVSDADKAHIARHDPARVLRDIEARRSIVDQYAEVAANDVDDVEYAHGWANALGLAVRHLATVYADHRDYREEWRP